MLLGSSSKQRVFFFLDEIIDSSIRTHTHARALVKKNEKESFETELGKQKRTERERERARLKEMMSARIYSAVSRQPLRNSIYTAVLCIQELLRHI